jgi:hypothetical protein
MGYAATMSATQERGPEQGIGLCASCLYGKRVESSRGSVFWMCELSRSDPRFPKYPRLPVLTCSGYAAQSPAGSQPS